MHNRKWIGDDLWRLLNLGRAELEEYYPNNKWYTLKAKRTLYRKKIREGKVVPPKKPSHEGPPKSERKEELAIDEATRLDLHNKLDEAIDNANVDPASIGRVAITVGEHTGYIKNNEGEIEYTEPLKRRGYSFSIEADRLEPPIQRVSSGKLPRKESLKGPKDNKSCVILPDLQIPFQDDEAISVAMQVIRDVRPDKVVLLGDAVDLAPWSKYPQRPEHQQTTQDSITKLHLLLATLRKSLPRSELVVLEGNHDFRMHAKISKDNPEALYLKKADDPDGYPVMSVPYLTSMVELDVEYVSGYPANKHWINERLQVQHGAKARSNSSTAKAISQDERASTIFGHVHRIETHYKTVNTYEGGKTSFAHTPGCLCLIDGSVPSTKGGVTVKGETVENYEDWQAGFCVVSYKEGDSPFHLEQVYINTFNGSEANYRGKNYSPDKKIIPWEAE